MHYGECPCCQGCKNIEIKTVVLEEFDCVMILMNWFGAENYFFNFGFPSLKLVSCSRKKIVN